MGGVVLVCEAGEWTVLKEIPYNNEKAQELVRHLTEPFDERMAAKYVEGNLVQKLTYKLNFSGIEKGIQFMDI